MDRHSFARRVIEESDDAELLEFLHFLEQTERSDNEYLALDATYMVRLVNETLDGRRGGQSHMGDSTDPG